MYDSAGGRVRPLWWSLLLIAALGALVLAAPASAGERQSADISQSCNAGDSGDDKSGDSASSGSGDCGNQRRVVQQSAGGSVSRSINQTQSFGNDDADTSSDRDEDEFDAEDNASVSAASSDCDDYSSQADAQAALEDGSGDSAELDGDDDGRACEAEFTQEVSGAPEGGVETGGGGTLARADGARDPLAQVARLAGPPLALALLVGGLLGLRRGRTV